MAFFIKKYYKNCVDLEVKNFSITLNTRVSYRLIAHSGGIGHQLCSEKIYTKR